MHDVVAQTAVSAVPRESSHVFTTAGDWMATLADAAPLLYATFKESWSAQVHQTLQRIRADRALKGLTLVAIVGGASSGKSTLFNNLIGGHVASRVTARGHATLGLIAAVHEADKDRMEALSATGMLFPHLRRRVIEPDDDQVGAPDELLVVYHEIAELAGVVLFDTPDFTSEAARIEGDVTLTLLPWFDRLIVVMDHERWFDRQSGIELKAQSDRLRQQRMVVFNRTRDDAMSAPQRILLEQQAMRINAAAMQVLDFRRGRGFRRFPPGILDPVVSFVRSAHVPRTPYLARVLADAAGNVFNQNAERLARMEELRHQLNEAMNRLCPTPRECMWAMMTPQEREYLDLIDRVLRLRRMWDWFSRTGRRFDGWLRRFPFGRSGAADPASDSHGKPAASNRPAVAFMTNVAARQYGESQRVAQASRFWDELHRWQKVEPPSCEFELPPELSARGVVLADRLNLALAQWAARVETECAGLSPMVAGSVGGPLVLAAVLMMVPGTQVAGFAAALKAVALAGGAGAILARPAGRAVNAVRERLQQSPQFEEVRRHATAIVESLAEHGRQCIERQLAAAQRWVFSPGSAVVAALECACDWRGEESRA